MDHVFLSRRNLLTLLSKLDRKAAGEETTCSIIKNDNAHLEYPQTIAHIMVTAIEDIEVHAVEDADYYTQREAGPMLAQDDPSLKERPMPVAPPGVMGGSPIIPGSNWPQ